MLQLLLRAIIGVICYLVFFYALPLVLQLLNVHPPAALVELLHVAALIAVLIYIVWGRPLPVPPAS